MTTLLHIEASPMGENSVSRAVTAEFLTAWKAANPEGTIVERDLSTNPVPLLDAEAIFADYTPDADRPETMAAKRALRGELIDEITSADEIVLSTPLWNWSVPGHVKAYIDQLFIPGVFDGSGTNPLAGKKVTVIMAQGGSYKPGTPREGWDFGSGYLETVFRATGAEDIEIILAELTLAGVAPGMDDLIGLKEQSIAAAKEAAATRAAQQSALV